MVLIDSLKHFLATEPPLICQADSKNLVHDLDMFFFGGGSRFKF